MSYKKYISEADLIPLQEKTKNLQEGGYGFDASRQVKVYASDLTQTDLTVGTIGFSYVSDYTPTKEELTNGEIAFYFAEDNKKILSIIPMFDDDMVYGGNVAVPGFEGSTTYFSVAYKTGYWTAGNITIEKPGIYVSNNNVDNATMEWLQFDWGNIHTIDPKFLPGGGSIETIDLNDYPVNDSTLGDILAMAAATLNQTPDINFEDVVPLVRSLNPNKLYRFKISSEFAPGANLLCNLRSMGVGDDGIIGSVTFGGAATFNNTYMDITITIQLNAEPYVMIDVVPYGVLLAIGMTCEGVEMRLRDEISDTYATKEELNTLASQISSLNTALENTLEGVDS